MEHKVVPDCAVGSASTSVEGPLLAVPIVALLWELGKVVLTAGWKRVELYKERGISQTSPHRHTAYFSEELDSHSQFPEDW